MKAAKPPILPKTKTKFGKKNLVLNRYAYVLNNPLKYTDPSGYLTQAEFWEILYNLWDSEFGGSWSGGGGGTNYYSNDGWSMQAGVDYNNYQGSWGNTNYQGGASVSRSFIYNRFQFERGRGISFSRAFDAATPYHYSANQNNNGFAVVVAWPMASAQATPLGRLFDWNDDGMNVGHAGIIIISSAGKATYYDYGRFDHRGQRPGNPRTTGVVTRTRMQNAVIENGLVSNLDEILEGLASRKYYDETTGNGYGPMIGGVFPNMNFEAMESYADALYSEGFLPFHSPIGLYCASFVRRVAREGGAQFGLLSFYPMQNIRRAPIKLGIYPKYVRSIYQGHFRY